MDENMVKVMMLTVPQTVHKKAIRTIIESHDCKKWIVARERGKGGYGHWQIRVETSDDHFFKAVKAVIPQAHIEESPKWQTKYERKEGYFWQYNDTNAVRQERFGEPRDWQKQAIASVRRQNDRQVDVWYDPIGNRGKSWLAGHLYETGQACIVPRDWTTPSEILNYLIHNYNDEGLIIIDIPRESKIPSGFYATVEMIKDGIIGSTKWEGSIRNIRGVKVMIMTNHMMDLTKLSKDRWRLHGINKENKVQQESTRGPSRNTSGPLFPLGNRGTR